MSYPIPSVYRTKNLLRLIDEIVLEGIENYNEIDLSLRENLVQLLVNDLGEEAYEAVIESPKLMLHHLRKYMATGQREYAFDLAETMAKAVFDYYDPIVSEIFNEAQEQHWHEVMQLAGKHKNIDRINGEIFYS